MKSKLITAVAILLFAAPANYAAAQFGQGISGYWTGFWNNSNGSSGYDVLDVVEYENGQIAGVWGKGYRIHGERTGPATFYWEALSEGSHYRAEARQIDPARLLVNYSVTYRKGGQVRTYVGASQLTRYSDGPDY